MADDFKMSWDTDLMEGDISVINGDLEHDAGLETAILMSLFTDRRANDDDELLDPDFPDKKGWWGDLVSPEVENDRIGSRLWLLYRSKTTEQALIKAKEYTKEALEWLIEDKVASSINITTERMTDKSDGWLAIKIEILKFNASLLNLRYEIQWTKQFSN